MIFLLFQLSCVSKGNKHFDQNKPTQKIEEAIDFNVLREQFNTIFSNSGALTIDSLIQKSKETNKPILLYFRAFSGVGGRKLEQTVLKDHRVLDLLESDYIFCPLYVDDLTELDEKEWVFYKKLNKTAKTVGKVNLFYQMEMLEMASTPYFVALNAMQEVIDLGEYGDFRNSEDFLDFLTKIRSTF